MGGNQPDESREQALERLSGRLEAERARLEQWRAVEPAYQRKYTEELAPLEQTLHQLRMKLVLCFDHAHKNMGLSKAEREFVSELVTEFSAELLFLDAKGELPADCDAARLRLLYKKHGGSDYDDDAAEETEAARAELMDALDIGPEELDALTPVQLLVLIQDQFDDDEAEALLEQARSATRKPVSNKVLVQALEEAERERLAHGALRVGATPDKGQPVAMPELEAELGEVLQQASFVEEAFKVRYDLDTFASFDPETVMEDLDADIVDIKEYIGEIEFELLQFSDQGSFKTWIKEMKREVAAINRREGRE